MTSETSSRERPPIRWIASTIMLAFIVQGVGVATWWAYWHRRAGHVVLTNDGPPLSVQVLDESADRPIGEPQDLIRRRTLELPSGDYRLRVEGEARLSRTYRLGVSRGETLTRALTLDDNRLLGERPEPIRGMPGPRHDPIPFDGVILALELTPGRSDLVNTSDAMRRRNGKTGEVIWDALAPTAPGQPTRPGRPWIEWLVAGPSVLGEMVEPLPDVNGDGTRDLVWIYHASFVAISGKDGSVAWNYDAELDGPGGSHPEPPSRTGPPRPGARTADLIGKPSTADLDRDGVPDIIATIAFYGSPSETPPGQSSSFRRVVVAVSGRTGHRLWDYRIDPAFATNSGIDQRPSAVVVAGRRTVTIAFADEAQWTGLDPEHRRARVGPIDLGFTPIRPLQYADLDGNGEPEILAVDGAAAPTTLSAFSIATGRRLWVVSLGERFQKPDMGTPGSYWPWVLELDGDGRSVIAVPDRGPLDPTHDFRGVTLLDGATGRPRWTRPMRPDTRSDDRVFGIIEAPDLDRDGVRDLVITSSFFGREPANASRGGPGEPERVYVDALSGKDGRPLWYWHADRSLGGFITVPTPRWWGRGPDDWPLLAVSILDVHPMVGHLAAPPSDADRPTVFMLAASTGRVVHTLPGFLAMGVADLDGDGLTDFWGATQTGPHADLRAFRGEPPEAWRVLGTFRPAQEQPVNGMKSRPAADLDGDGIADTLIAELKAPADTPGEAMGSRTVVARSGRDGHLLWTADLGQRRGWFDRDMGESYKFACSPTPAGDLDGDGTPDVVVTESAEEQPAGLLGRPATLPLSALSGRTGHLLWLAGALPTGFEAHGYSNVLDALPRVVEPGRAADLIVHHRSPFVAASPRLPASNAPRRDHLARVDGRTGRILWDVPLIDLPAADMSRFHFSPTPAIFRDLDGDGAVDRFQILHSARNGVAEGSELQAVSLRDGRLLWSQNLDSAHTPTSPNVAEIDLADPERAAVPVMSTSGTRDAMTVHVRALDARDGKALWSWKQDGVIWQSVGLMTARLGPDRKRRTCVMFDIDASSWFATLDLDGREVRRHQLPSAYYGVKMPVAVDLDGDGRDELLVIGGGRLRAWDDRFAELWSRPYDDSSSLETIVPAAGGRPAMILLETGLALDGRTGRPTWLDPRPQDSSSEKAMLLDPGDHGRQPLSIHHTDGLTIARWAMPTTPEGRAAPPLGAPVPRGAAADDPRWVRPLPWANPIRHAIGLLGLVSCVGLAVANVAAPLMILRLATRRRPWTLRLVIVLPLVAAIPLWVFQTVGAMIPGEIGGRPLASRTIFLAATAAGVPIVALAAATARADFGVRRRNLAVIAGLTLAVSVLIASIGIGIDSRKMPAIEHYGRSDWPLLALPGAFVAGGLILVEWLLRNLFRAIKVLVGRSRHADATTD